MIMRRVTGAILIVLLAAACNGGGESEPSATVSTAAVPSTTPATTAPPPTATPVPPTATATTTAAPSAVRGVELLVAAPTGVHLIEPDGTASLLIDAAAAFAIDDLNGGVVFQLERRTRQGRSIVYRVRADGAAPVQMLVPEPDQGLTLLGAVRAGADTHVYYSRNEGTEPDDARETLRRYSLRTREVTELETIGGWESGAFPIAISERLILYNWFAEAVHGMRFTDLEANPAAVAANPSPPDGYFDCWSCPGVGELSPAGDRLVHYEFDRSHQAVIADVATGTELRRIDLPTFGDDWFVVSFDLSPSHLVVNRADVDEGTIGPALVYDLTVPDPLPQYLDMAGEAYLTLAPVTVRGPIPGP